MSEADNRILSDLLIDRVEFANVIIPNKTDLTTEEEIESLEGVLRKFNPDAKFIRAEQGRVDTGRLILRRRL